MKTAAIDAKYSSKTFLPYCTRQTLEIQQHNSRKGGRYYFNIMSLCSLRGGDDDARSDSQHSLTPTMAARGGDDFERPVDPLQLLGRPRVLVRSLSNCSLASSCCSVAAVPPRGREEAFGRTGGENGASSVGGGGGYVPKTAGPSKAAAERAPFSPSDANANEIAGAGSSRSGRIYASTMQAEAPASGAFAPGAGSSSPAARDAQQKGAGIGGAGADAGADAGSADRPDSGSAKNSGESSGPGPLRGRVLPPPPPPPKTASKEALQALIGGITTAYKSWRAQGAAPTTGRSAKRRKRKGAGAAVSQTSASKSSLLIEPQKLEELSEQVKLVIAQDGCAGGSRNSVSELPVDDVKALLCALDAQISTTALRTPGGQCNDEWDCVRSSMYAALAATSIMTVRGVDPRLVQEEPVEHTLLLCKQQLNWVVFPAFDAAFRGPVPGPKAASPPVVSSTRNTGVTGARGKQGVGSKKRRRDAPAATRKAAGDGNAAGVVRLRRALALCPWICDIVDRFESIVRSTGLEDSLLMQMSTLGLSSFFVQGSAPMPVTNGSNPFAASCSPREFLCTLQLGCMELMRAIFERYPRHRTALLAEIFSGLVKLPTSKQHIRCYRLYRPDIEMTACDQTRRTMVSRPVHDKPRSSRSGTGAKCIQMVSALLMQLVQSCAGLPAADGMDGAESGPGPESKVAKRRGYACALDAAKYFLSMLVNRCSHKDSKSDASKDYREIMKNLVDDMLTVLFLPEWPSAEAILQLLCTSLSTLLNVTTAGGSGGQKPKRAGALGIQALDIIGQVVARLRPVTMTPGSIVSLCHDAEMRTAIETHLRLLQPKARKPPAPECNVEPILHPRPPGRAPARKVWDRHRGCWVPRKPRPRGRAPSGKIWDPIAGRYKEKGATEEPMKGGVSGRPLAVEERHASGRSDKDGSSPMVSDPRSAKNRLLKQLLLKHLLRRGKNEGRAVLSAMKFSVSQWFQDDWSRAQQDGGGALTENNGLSSIYLQWSRWMASSKLCYESPGAEAMSDGAPYSLGAGSSLEGAGSISSCVLLPCGDGGVHSHDHEARTLCAGDAARVMRHLAICRTEGLAASCDRLLGRLLSVLSMGVPRFRARAVRALSRVVESDPALLSNSSVQKTICRHCVDTSISVREAVIDLVGREMKARGFDGSFSYSEYLKMLLERMKDRGVSVRKRVIKILRDLLLQQPPSVGEVCPAASYTSHSTPPSPHQLRPKLGTSSGLMAERTRTMIFTHLVQRIVSAQEEESIKDLALSTFEQVWFSASTIDTHAGHRRRNRQMLRTAVSVSPPKSAANTIKLTCGGETQNRCGANALKEIASAHDEEEAANDGAHVLESHVLQIVDVVAEISNDGWLVSMLTRLLRDTGGNDQIRGGKAATTSRLKARRQQVGSARAFCRKLVDALVDHLVKLDEGAAPLYRSGRKLGLQTVACFRTLYVFCAAYPALLARHIETLSPYLSKSENFHSGMTGADETRVMEAVSGIVNMLLPLVFSPHMVEDSDVEMGGRVGCRRPSPDFFAQLVKNLEAIMFERTPNAMIMASKCLGTLARCETGDDDAGGNAGVALRRIVQTFYAFVSKEVGNGTCTTLTFSDKSPGVIQGVTRALFVLGIVSREYDFDAGCEKAPSSSGSSSSSSSSSGGGGSSSALRQVGGPKSDASALDAGAPLHEGYVARGVLKLFLCILSGTSVTGGGVVAQRPQVDLQIREKALLGLSFLLMQHPRFMLRKDTTECVRETFDDPAQRVRVASIRAFRGLLEVEETRVDMGSALARTTRRSTVQERVIDDKDAGASVLGGAMQELLPRALELATHDTSVRVRHEAALFVNTLIRQGMANPVQCIPPVVALLGDISSHVRDCARSCLGRLHEKHPRFISTHLQEGVKRAFEFQRRIFGVEAGLPTEGSVAAIASAQNKYISDVRKWQTEQRGQHRQQSRQQQRPPAKPSPAALGREAAKKATGPSIFSAVWRGCISSHRRNRNEVLHSLVKQFNFANTVAAQLPLLRYIASMLATLQYTVLEEALFVIYHVDRLVLLLESDVCDPESGEDGRAPPEGKSLAPNRRSSAFAYSMALLLEVKQHLRRTYRISDAQCADFDPRTSKAAQESPISEYDGSVIFQLPPMPTGQKRKRR